MTDNDPGFLPSFFPGRGSGYEQVPELMVEMIERAVQADLEHAGYRYEDGLVYAPGWIGSQDEGTEPGSPSAGDLIFGGDVEKALTIVTLRWTDRITTAFQNWLPLPDPSWFDGEIQRVNDALSSLAIFGQFGQGGEAGVTANPDLAGAITNLENRTGELRGQHIEVFNEYYAAKVGPVVSTFGASIYPLALALSGEQEIWTRARDSLGKLADAASDAFWGSRPDGTSVEDVKKALAVAGAVIAVASIPLTGGASLAAAGAAAAVGASATTLDFLPAEAPEDAALAGEHPDDVYSKLLAALSTLDRQIRDEESGIRNTINGWLPSITGSNDDRIDIARPGIIDADDSNSVLSEGSIRQNRGIVNRLAHEHIPLVTSTLTSAAGQLESDPTLWTRSDLGLGTIGPWADYDYLRGLLVPRMEEVGAELDRAGRILWESFLLVQGADDDSDHDLRKLQTKLPPVAGDFDFFGG